MRRLVVAGLGLAMLAGCSIFDIFSSAPKNKPNELAPINATLNVRQIWTASIGAADQYFFSPAISGGDLYVVSANGQLAHLDLATGRVVWQIDAGVPLSSGVGTDGGTIVVVGARGELLAFDPDGKQRWKVTVNGEVLSAPVVGTGLVVIRTSDGRFIGYDSGTGKRRWTYTPLAQPLVLRGAPGMIISGPFLYAGLPGGRLIALTLSNGGLRWDTAIAIPKGATELERVADVVGTPVLSAREICVATFQGRAGCVDAASGNVIWTRDLSSSAGIGADPRYAFVTAEKSVVQAFSRNGGASVWRNDKLYYRGLSAPVSSGRAAVVGDFQGVVHWLSREDGSIIARMTTDGSPIRVAPVVFAIGALPAVIVQTQKGNLYAYSSE